KKPRTSSPASLPMRRTSGAPQKLHSAAPKRRAKTDSRLNWQGDAWRTLCKPLRTVNPPKEETMPATKRSASASPIDRDMVRVDGPLKVSGQAQYTSDLHFAGLLYAVPVGATIANGELTGLNTEVAEKMPGVRAILHRGNIGPIYRSTPQPGFEGVCEERRPPFEDDVI